jgi:alpha-methylacyl-CoA racemase
MTGWGQDGPLADVAGHDINYISVTGVLAAIGTADSPTPPLNLVGDYGGGSTFLVMAVLAALVERDKSGLGQSVDVAMVDGVGVLAQQMLGMRTSGEWTDEREANLLDGGCPYYRTYRCADGRHVAVGAIEPRFYAQLLNGLGLADTAIPDREDRTSWKALAAIFADAFGKRSRDEWADQFRLSDACVTPVLTFTEAVHHDQVASRKAILCRESGIVSGLGPKFSRSKVNLEGEDASLAEVLVQWSRS